MMARIKKSLIPTITSKSDDIIPVQTKPIEQLFDAVNDISQKESAMHSSGVTRRKVYNHINDLLTATIETKDFDAETKTWITNSVPDMDKRTKGAELALKAFGDLKEMQKVDGPKTYNTVIYQWKQ